MTDLPTREMYEWMLIYESRDNIGDDRLLAAYSAALTRIEELECVIEILVSSPNDLAEQCCAHERRAAWAKVEKYKARATAAEKNNAFLVKTAEANIVAAEKRVEELTERLANWERRV